MLGSRYQHTFLLFKLISISCGRCAATRSQLPAEKPSHRGVFVGRVMALTELFLIRNNASDRVEQSYRHIARHLLPVSVVKDADASPNPAGNVWVHRAKASSNNIPPRLFQVIKASATELLEDNARIELLLTAALGCFFFMKPINR